MGLLFDEDIWLSDNRYITPHSDFRYHNFTPENFDLGDSCVVIFSSDLFRRVQDSVSTVDEGFVWPYETTPLKICESPSGKRFGLHFPSYGGTRIANSLEQLAACGYRYVFGIGLGGTPRDDVEVGDFILLEGAVRGDGVSSYYAPLEFPGVADFRLTAMLMEELEKAGERYHLGISFGVDALYRETYQLIDRLRKLRVLSIDLESSAFLTVGRRLNMRCCWTGVVSDRLLSGKHQGSIHSEHVGNSISRLAGYVLGVIERL